MKSFAVGIWGAFWAVTWVAVAGSGAGSAVAAALATDEGPAVSYRVSFANAVHHEAEIEVTFRGVTADPLEVRMSRSSPGRYGLHEFARHVYDVRAVDGAGKELTIARPDPHQWNVGGHDGTVVVTYTLFGDLVSGTYTAIDATHAHLNAPATFLWARGMTERPVRVRLVLPEGDWRVATQLAETDEPGVFAAPDMQYLMDSPIEISDFVLREWTVGEGDEAQAFRLALHHAGTEEEADAYGRLAETVVREQAALWGELPRFDHGQYTFLADYLPYSDGDGMEHRNSTVLSSSRSLADAPIRLLRTLSHEFFHAWNVERIRPRSLEPFDFERENMSGELWFAEGFTNYYDGLVLCRAGIVDLDGYAEDISGTVNAVMNTPATRYGSPVDMSLRAPLVDGATWVDPQNLGNIFLTYYTFGDAVGLALDLTLRTRTEKTLDDFLRAVWEKYGREETPYTNADLEATLAEVTGDEEFAKGFFTRYVYGREVADYGSLLAAAGLVLRKENEGAASWGGARLTKGDGGVEVGGPPPVDSPLYRAGISRGDVITTVDGTDVATREDMEALLEGYAPGAEVQVDYRQRGRELTAMVTLDEDRTVEVVPVEHLGETPSEAAVAFRESWLGSKSGYVDASLGRRCPTCQRRYPLAHEYCGHDGKELVIDVAE